MAASMALPSFVPLSENLPLLSLLLCTISLVTGYVTYLGLPYLIFAYNCFLKPYKTSRAGDQQDALESFYKGQAAIYDATRARLLRGRAEMLALAAAQLKHKNQSERFQRRVWVDIGGGTGYNIEKLHEFISVPDTFSEVFLVDFSPSLCAVAKARFQKLGWTNVHVVCTDARAFRLPTAAGCTEERKVDWISMSYSLSMIPDFFSVIDSLSGLLAPTGLLSVADFYVQSFNNFSGKTYTGGFLGRHVNWFSRQFWRIWFEFDRVNLDEGRRDYLEYRFGCIISINNRNWLVGGVPYYIFVGCPKLTTHAYEPLERADAAITESPYLSPVVHNSSRSMETVSKNTSTSFQLHSKGFEAAVLNLSANLPLPSAFYQNHPWRVYYDELLEKHTQFNNSYIYAFTWEDARVDQQLLKITGDDVVLCLTSAGDNVLSYILDANPRRIHAVDLNPAQNHLLELKLAAFTALGYDDIWKIFGEGHHSNFRALLMGKLSPHLSSRALQFWIDNSSTFAASGGGLYETGRSGIAIRAAKWLFRCFGLAGAVRDMCAATALQEQQEIWRSRVRPVMLSWWVSWAIIGNEQFLWKALGVPKNQRDLILSNEHSAAGGDSRPSTRSGGSGMQAIWQYVVDTFDPVIEKTLLSEDNHFYLLCLLGSYTPRCHPSYLSPVAHEKLSRPGAFDGVRLHTDEINEVLGRIQPGTLTLAVIMDSMDWFDPTSGTEAREQIRRLSGALKEGGRVFLRSAGLSPWYTKIFEEEGFVTVKVGCRDPPGTCIDRVNMYASAWICTKAVLQDNLEKLDL